MKQSVARRAIVKLIRWFSWMIIAILILLLIPAIALQIPSVQNMVTQRAIQFLEEKIKTEVGLESIYISFPKKVILKKLYLEDQAKDTLFFAETLSIDTDLWGLTRNKIELNDVIIENCNTQVNRPKQDSAFNFSYIIKSFSTDTLQQSKQASVSTPWVFNIENISLLETRVTFSDRLSGNDVRTHIGALTLDLDKFDLNRMLFSIKSFSLKNADARVKQNPDTVINQEADSANSLPSISISSLNFENVGFQYLNLKTGQHIESAIDQFQLDANDINLNKRLIDIEHISLIGSSLTYLQNKSKPLEKPNHEQKAAVAFNTSWKISINELKLSNNNVTYDNNNFASIDNSADFNHIDLSQLSIDANKLMIHGSSAEATVKNISLLEKKGFSIHSLATHISLTNRELLINDFNFQSPNSKLKIESRFTFASLASLSQSTFDLKIKPSTIALRDVLYFATILPDSIPIFLAPSTTAEIEGNLKGSINDLTINHLSLKTLDSTVVELAGKVIGITKPASSVASIVLKKFRTTRSDIESIVNDSLLESIQLPEWIEISGHYKGKIKTPTVQTLLISPSGNIRMNGNFDFNALPFYNAVLKTEQLQLGKILNQPDIDDLTMTASIKGSGLTVDTINATIDLLVEKIRYNQYDYKDFKLNGTIQNYLFSGTASLHDENLDFTLTSDLNYNKEDPLYTLKLDIVNADFKKLNLSERSLRARGTVDLRLATRDFQLINGKMAIRKVAVYNGKSLYTVDSLLVVSVDQEDESNLTIQSDILSGEFKGNFNLSRIGGVIQRHINRYFSPVERKSDKFETPQQFNFNLVLKNTDLISDVLFPQLESFIPGKIEGEFDSEKNILKAEVGFAQIQYATTAIDSISMLIDSDAEALHYKLRAKDIKLDTLQIDAVQLIGKVEHDSIHTVFQILNSKNEEMYTLGGVIKSQQGRYRVHLLQDELLLNRMPWSTPPDNYLDVSKRGLTAYNFFINHGSEKAALITGSKDSTISIEFNQFQLSSLTRMVRGVIPASGTLNGNLKFSSSNKGQFNSTLKLDNFKILEKPVGNVTLELSHVHQQYLVKIEMRDSITHASISGRYTSGENEPHIDLSVKLHPINLQAIEPLLFGQAKNIKGLASGDLTISGTPAAPSIHGELTFQQVSFKSAFLNSNFTLANEKISFEKTGINLNNVTIQDNKKNKAIINGSILTTAYKEFRLNLNISTKNFRILNTTEDDNELFYGKVSVNTTGKVTGSTNRPRIDMSVSFSKGSDFTYVVPQRQKTVAEREGVVQFVDRDAAHDPFLRNLSLGDTTVAPLTGINISSTLELTDEETLNIVIDPVSGDKLSVKGNADLTFNMSANGNMNLSGRYEVSEGTYELSLYKFIKRKFNIEKGGTIMWAGNPLYAMLDLRASYKVETSPFDLISNQLQTTDQAQLNSYRQRLPFLVYLNLQGQMLSPQVNFQLGMPVDKRGAFGGSIYAKLNDINSRESDVNKQVFALLILKRFVSDNPLQKVGGIESTTRTSASRLLSDQLNRLSENVKGLELSFDIKSYEGYPGADRGDTQVQLGVSKSLFHDRLVVKLSGNVDVEGESNQQEDVNDYIGDIALEYKLTSDGRFRITGFRTGNYDMIDGELTETGVGLIYIKDFNTLTELFKRNAKSK